MGKTLHRWYEIRCGGNLEIATKANMHL